MPMDNLDTILEKLQDSEEIQVFHLAGMLTDPLTRKIMAKLASPQNPISVANIPTDKLKADKGAIISRLSKLEHVGLLMSEKVPTEGGFCKKYSINAKGKDLVSKYMQNEARQFE